MSKLNFQHVHMNITVSRDVVPPLAKHFTSHCTPPEHDGKYMPCPIMNLTFLKRNVKDRSFNYSRCESSRVNFLVFKLVQHLLFIIFWICFLNLQISSQTLKNKNAFISVHCLLALTVYI